MDMEVAGQWRREWAGTAEYGKVTEGGVTRQVARAMEVLHASAPGARVRVMRAAYHSSAGPGAPAASYLMHSSRRVRSITKVITSGFNLLESPSFPIKPLGLSSTPLESSPDCYRDAENYKVTEPDDIDISEPSKWKSSTGGSSLRMPSEESSSTDNASIIDLDSRSNHKSVMRRYSGDSENSDITSIRRNSSRVSPLLDAPVALSTLKYKSLLNGSNDWNHRRKSYSFEDTSPLNETIVHSNDTLAMESSTDSGICKSTEIVNDTDNDRKERKYDKHEETFQGWLSKNRSNAPFYKGNQMKSYREHNIVVEDPLENNISLQSSGKVSITVPIKVEVDEDYRITNGSDDSDRKVKKVEFCKTELHFAAESGKVNIIATDEKPPPTNDFRKRRSAFVPIHEDFEKPVITLLSENKDFPETGGGEFSNYTKSEFSEFDENTAATKSILKNKIPKPKPYLLGENMAFGRTNDVINKTEDHLIYRNSIPAVVTLINKQLQAERRDSNEVSSFSSTINSSINKKDAFRTTHKGPLACDSFKNKKKVFEIDTITTSNEINNKRSVKNTFKILQMSPIQGRAKTRQLRESDLTYFGIDKVQRMNNERKPKSETSLQFENRDTGDIFHSVKLIQQVSNSVCNSEAESEDTPEYQNIPIKTNFAPVPIPRQRSMYQNKPEFKEIGDLKPVIEQEDETNISISRRSKFKRQDSITPSSRSISEPPKMNKYSSLEKSHRRHDHHKTHTHGIDSTSPWNNNKHEVNEEKLRKNGTKTNKSNINNNMSEDEHMYVNLSLPLEERKMHSRADSIRRRAQKIQNAHTDKIDRNTNKSERQLESIKSYSKHISNGKQEKVTLTHSTDIKNNNQNNINQNKQHSIRKKKSTQKAENLPIPEYSIDNQQKLAKTTTTTSTRKSQQSNDKTDEEIVTHKLKHRSRSLQRPLNLKSETEDSEKLNKVNESTKDHTVVANEVLENGIIKYRTRKSSKDKLNGRNESSKALLKLDINSTDSHSNSPKSKTRETKSTERIANSKVDNPKISTRSEYVINYDDKNGTVSSICKVKPGSGTSKKKKTTKEKYNDSPREFKVKNKASEKTALLQLPDRQRNANRLSYAESKWKRKMHVQRTCQLL